MHILKLIWNHDGGRWRKHYFLHPWRIYFVYRAQANNETWVPVSIPVSDAEIYQENI